MKKNKISIVINCFNSEKYLSEAIESVLKQNYKNWELIIWDNKSIDNTKKIIHSYKDKRIKYFFSKKHTSLHKARNLALSKISGEYLTFLDSDDYWNNKFRLNFLLEKIKKNKNLACVYSKFIIKYQNSILPNRISTKKNLYSGIIFNNLIQEYNFGIGSALFRVKKLNSFPRLFNTKFDYISDFDFIMRLSKNCKFDNIDLPLYTYRKRKDSMSNLNLKSTIFQMEKWAFKMLKKNFFNKYQYEKIINHLNHLKFKKELRLKNFYESFKYLFSNEFKIPFYKKFLYYFFDF